MAGDKTMVAVGEGEAVRIMTGAPLPPGADAVCMLEHTRAKADGVIVIIEEAVDPGTNVRHTGEDIASGAEVFARGTVLTPPHIGVLASLGLDEVLVYPHLRVGVVSTGDELAQGRGALSPGKIRDANRPALLAQLRAEGWQTIDLGPVGDDEMALLHAFERGALVSDAVVVSGGVGAGDRDFVKVALEKMSEGTMRWMQVAVKPAKPFAFGTLATAGTPVFGLPGNPVAALVSYELFVRPALRAMAGHRGLERPSPSSPTATVWQLAVQSM
jgi:molybdenum cofactor synthesis domain-containing protein